MQLGCATSVSIALVMSSSVALSSFLTCRSVRTSTRSVAPHRTRHAEGSSSGLAGEADLERVAVGGALFVVRDRFIPGKLVEDVRRRDEVALGCDLVRKAQDGAGDLGTPARRTRWIRG